MRSDSIATLGGVKSGLRHMTGGKGPLNSFFLCSQARRLGGDGSLPCRAGRIRWHGMSHKCVLDKQLFQQLHRKPFFRLWLHLNSVQVK